ncbi:hypothetical protein SAMN04488008_102616 [Maribacter orientalis]|uniref:DUF748 domain-containing protein n=1 Tax=Maribacter orientalis TaxID=228957 RepID=A0A1H7LQ01_9FLAO|nr:hypothetical protein [Maribacter orientalis]SEL01062.1 hypothetical protein SAMN04488008_102616 [Maribacter orientalis]
MTRFLKWFLVLIIFFIGAYIAAEWKMKKEVVDFLNRKVPDHIDFSYDRLNINLFKGDLEFEKVEVKSLGRQTSSCEIIINADNLSISGFSYWKIFFEKSIYLKNLTLSKPRINFKTCPKESKQENATKSNPINLLKEIFIEELILDSGIVEILDSNEEKELLSVKSIDLNLKNVATDPWVINKYVPFTFSEYAMSIQHVKAPVGKFEELEIETMKLDNSSIHITDISLSTILSKSELSKTIRYQRDHLTLDIPEIRIENHNYIVSNDSLQVNFKSLLLNAPVLEMYRDKSRLEDLNRRPLYAELFRELPFKVAIDSVLIKEGMVRYEENLPNDKRAGILSFEKLNASMSNFSNLTTNKENLKITVDADLMGAGNFNLDWEFNVQDTRNSFVISGGLSNFNTANLNDFLIPNLRTKTTGTIDQLYFTISGDEYAATGDIKMNYEDFKFQVLNKERNGVKKVLSFIGNLFINDGSKADSDGYRHGHISTERIKNKSFFNYLWINLQDGLLDVLTGNGMKE